MEGFSEGGAVRGGYCSLVLPANSLKVSSVTPQQKIIESAIEKRPDSMYKHINTALLSTWPHVSKHHFASLIEYEMYYFISSLSFFFSQMDVSSTDTTESKVPSSCPTSATMEELMTTVCIDTFCFGYSAHS